MAEGKGKGKEPSPLNCITPDGIATFVHVWEPHAFVGPDGTKKDPSFRLMLVFDEDADLSEMRDIVKKSLIAKFGEAKAKALHKAGKLSLPFRDAGEYEQEYGEPFESGRVMVSFSSRTAPGVVDARAKPIMDQQDFYPGCKARVSCYAHAFDTLGNKGVTFLLNNVQKRGDGKRLAGARKSAEEEFGGGKGGSGESSELDDIF